MEQATEVRKRPDPGVGMERTPPLYLQPGQTIQLGITGLVEQRQELVATD